ncbi:phage holin family protein [Nocardioides sp. GCM10027113]|uniref:phage holin family protein n=1 Tax=unclassified Nocardioides TaxID=2615069 RepID=UPI003615EBC4
MNGSHDTSTGPLQEETLGALVHRLSEDVPALVRSEVRLAQAELTEKGKRAGVGLGVVGAAGVLAFLGLATLVAAAVLGVALALPAWAAALVVAGALLLAAALAGRRGAAEIGDATPPVPERAAAGVRDDLAALKGDAPRHAGRHVGEERR